MPSDQEEILRLNNQLESNWRHNCVILGWACRLDMALGEPTRDCVAISDLVNKLREENTDMKKSLKRQSELITSQGIRLMDQDDIIGKILETPPGMKIFNPEFGMEITEYLATVNEKIK